MSKRNKRLNKIKFFLIIMKKKILPKIRKKIETNKFYISLNKNNYVYKAIKSSKINKNSKKKRKD